MAASPGLLAELPRLNTVRAQLLGICGDANHTWGYHVARPAAGDYSLSGAANRPAGDYCCAIDVGMGWPASRDWLRWLIREIREDRIQGVAEVIGSYDVRNVRYWSDASGWHEDGVPYQGDGHDSWTHIGIYRSTALTDHRLLAGWTPHGHTQEEDDMAGALEKRYRMSDGEERSLEQMIITNCEIILNGQPYTKDGHTRAFLRRWWEEQAPRIAAIEAHQADIDTKLETLQKGQHDLQLKLDKLIELNR